MNPDQTAPKEQSDLGAYCEQYSLHFSPFHLRYRLTGTLTKSEDPDEMLHRAAFYQGLHCFLR